MCLDGGDRRGCTPSLAVCQGGTSGANALLVPAGFTSGSQPQDTSSCSRSAPCTLYSRSPVPRSSPFSAPLQSRTSGCTKSGRHWQRSSPQPAAPPLHRNKYSTTSNSPSRTSTATGTVTNKPQGEWVDGMPRCRRPVRGKACNGPHFHGDCKLAKGPPLPRERSEVRPAMR